MTTVTIGKAYFEALLRKAQFHALDKDPTSILIPKAEYASLLQAGGEYHLLKSALLRGGLSPETLKVLIQGENDTESGIDACSLHQLSVQTHTPPCTSTISPPTTPLDSTPTRYDSRFFHQAQGFPQITDESELDSPEGSMYNDENCREGIPQRVPTQERRTILISNLPERTTHKDLIKTIQGGSLLEIYLRNNRTALVSFVQGAAEFLSYTKCNDIYLYMKRLEFRWASRQFYVPPHVSHKINGGASRNLVIRNIANKITADEIRDHLDHIHNLVVVDIHFRNGDAFVSTNSIHNALFARTCLMSRTVYKRTRIEFYPDGCAVPLPQDKAQRETPVACIPKKPKLTTNPYALLSMGSDCSTSDSSDDSSRGEDIATNS